MVTITKYIYILDIYLQIKLQGLSYHELKNIYSLFIITLSSLYIEVGNVDKDYLRLSNYVEHNVTHTIFL